MADDPNVPDEVKSWVRHPVPPEVLAAIMADFDEAEFTAEVRAMLSGQEKTYTMAEILAEIEADASLPPRS